MRDEPLNIVKMITGVDDDLVDILSHPVADRAENGVQIFIHERGSRNARRLPANFFPEIGEVINILLDASLCLSATARRANDETQVLRTITLDEVTKLAAFIIALNPARYTDMINRRHTHEVTSG